MDGDTLVRVVVAAVVLLLLLALAAWLLRRRAARRRAESVAEADRLRSQAAGRSGDLQSAEQRARQADAAAERARAQAQQAERAAAQAHRTLDHERAVQEDVVRQADELDPRVDTRTDGYEPVTGPALKDPGATSEGPGTVDGRHRGAGPVDGQA